MRFATQIRPKNYLLLACHATNEVVQLYQLRRYYRGRALAVTSDEVCKSFGLDVIVKLLLLRMWPNISHDVEGI